MFSAMSLSLQGMGCQTFGTGRIGVVNRDYHQQSHCEIGGDKRIYQHLSGSVPTYRQLRELLLFRVLRLASFRIGMPAGFPSTTQRNPDTLLAERHVPKI